MRRTGRPSTPLGRPAGDDVINDEPRREFEYKIITSGDERYFSGKFSPEALQSVLNEHAGRGWRVVSATSSEYTTLTGRGRNELVVVLERSTR